MGQEGGWSSYFMTVYCLVLVCCYACLQVTVNEEVDPTLVIRRLKQENQLLRQELQLLKGGNGSPGADGGADGQGEPQEPKLSEDERGRLRQRIRAFIEDESADASLDVEGDMHVIRTGAVQGKGRCMR